MALRLLVLSLLLLNAVYAQDGGGGGDGGGDGEEEACDKDFDLVFVIDGSGSIEQAGRGNFNRIKQFIKQLVRGLSRGVHRLVCEVVCGPSQLMVQCFRVTRFPYHFASSQFGCER